MRLRIVPALMPALAVLALAMTGAVADPGEPEDGPARSGTHPDEVDAASSPTMVGNAREDTPDVVSRAAGLGEKAESVAPEDSDAGMPGERHDDIVEPILEGVPSKKVSTDGADLVGVIWDLGQTPDRVEIRALSAEGWGDWTHAPAAESEESETVGTDPFWIGDAIEVEVRAIDGDHTATDHLRVELIDTEAVAADDTTAAEAESTEGSDVVAEDDGTAVASASGTGSGVASAGVPVLRPTTSGAGFSRAAPSTSVPGTSAPVIISRAGWGANESWRGGSASYAGETEAAVLHHTAGSNSYTRSQSASIVRGIYSYHTRTLGWNDIGYNVLVDKYGQIFEGRAGGLHRNVIGAHALGSNTGTFGVSIMGNHSNAVPSSSAQNAVVRIVAWKLGSSYIFDVNDRVTVDNKAQLRLFGHRDARQGATACPGARAYALMPDLRSRVQEALGGYRTASHHRWVDAGGRSVLGAVVESEAVVDGQRTTRYSSGMEIVHSNEGAVITDPTLDLSFDRIGGSDRYEVSANASQKAFPRGAAHVMIASGELYSDALASAPMAARVGGPLLLVRENVIPSSVLAELRRLSPDRITIAGGAPTVSAQVERQLSSVTGATVDRVGGKDRYEVSAGMVQDGKPIFVASGELYSDALSAGSAAALTGGSVVLTQKNSLPAPVAAAIARNKNQNVYIVGGTPTVTEKVEREIRDLGVAPLRVGGKDRYAVSANLIDTVKPGGSKTVYVASGMVFSDALSAVSIASVSSSPVMLALPQTMLIDTRLYLREGPTSRAVLVGGEPTLYRSITLG